MSGPPFLRRALAVALAAAGTAAVVAAVLLTGDDDAVAPTQVAQVVPLPGPVAPGRPALTGPPFRGALAPAAPAAVPVDPAPSRSGVPAPAPPSPLPGSASPLAGRNPFLVPTQLPAAEPGTEPGPVASPPGPPPGGRNPFIPLVGPIPSPSRSTDQPAQPAIGTTPEQAQSLLRRGSTGPEVTAVQQRLADRGWRIAVDGVFGPRTEAVVLAFQRRRDLLADGVVGPRTRAAIG